MRLPPDLNPHVANLIDDFIAQIGFEDEDIQTEHRLRFDAAVHGVQLKG